MGNLCYVVFNLQNNLFFGLELILEIEFGFDLCMFNGCFGVDIVYYDWMIEDQIFFVFVLVVIGFIFKIFNVGEMCNYGVEFQVNVVLIEIENFQWNIILNVLC